MVLVFWTSPNQDGLTAACAKAACDGVAEAGKEVESVQLNKKDVRACLVCGNGWGSCREGHVCVQKDDFAEYQKKILAAEAVVLVTPVYWGDLSETMKAFTDRLRRCEALKPDKGELNNKPVVLVAAAGGTGNGTISCLENMDRMIKHMGMNLFDAIRITRFTRSYKLADIKAAARAMCESL